jgi:hypothetical protein
LGETQGNKGDSPKKLPTSDNPELPDESLTNGGSRCGEVVEENWWGEVGLFGVELLRSMQKVRRFPRVRGEFIYFLQDKNGVIIYVGRSESLGQRLCAHRAIKNFHSASYVTAPRKMAGWAEAVFIAILNPSGNRKHPKFRITDLAYVTRRYFKGNPSLVPNLPKVARAAGMSLEDLIQRITLDRANGAAHCGRIVGLGGAA